MPGLDPRIHGRASNVQTVSVDGRVKPGHDERSSGPSTRQNRAVACDFVGKHRSSEMNKPASAPPPVSDRTTICYVGPITDGYQMVSHLIKA
jgi:hypothetical protein